ncbi:tyrosine-type recombinase/integrase [Nesterenkonia natronophila]|uniref:Tyr recombinase domain-containing protein n=1 Tax=Nesterenkonia natronophila TaxID=2174932 RepID=A0A3A4F9B4_9MICC|nr:hypothetical protein D3250_06585 [Nesterenkonia natronophila]
MAKELGIPLLERARSHMWRTTLTSRYIEAGMAREDVAAMLGHDEQTNLRSYTDRTDTRAARAAYRSKRGAQGTTV